MATTEQYRVADFASYVGQDALKRTLNVYINACTQKDNERPLPHVLLEGPPGMGKTSLARLISKAVGDPIVEVDLAETTPARLVSILRQMENGGIVFFDEVHRASKKQMEMLLKLMDEGILFGPNGVGVSVPWLSVIAATTEPEKLPLALVQRFTIHPEFVDYTDDEATQIVKQMAMANVEMPSEVADELGKACAGTPRLARDLVMAYEALSYGTDPTVADVLTLVGVDSEGLSNKHVAYLKALNEMDGMAGERALMSVLQMSQGALRDLERILVKRGMVRPTARGRMITSKGNARLSGTTVARGRFART